LFVLIASNFAYPSTFFFLQIFFYQSKISVLIILYFDWTCQHLKMLLSKATGDRWINSVNPTGVRSV